MHPEARAWIEANLPPNRDRVIELGSLNVNGSIRDLFDGGYVGVDLKAGPGVDVVADAADVDLEPADLVVACELLEHTPHGQRIVENARKLTRPSGRFIVTCAGLSRSAHGQHGAGQPVEGEWYNNISCRDLEYWFGWAGFDDWKVQHNRQGADLYGMAW